MARHRLHRVPLIGVPNAALSGPARFQRAMGRHHGAEEAPRGQTQTPGPGQTAEGAHVTMSEHRHTDTDKVYTGAFGEWRHPAVKLARLIPELAQLIA